MIMPLHSSPSSGVRPCLKKKKERKWKSRMEAQMTVQSFFVGCLLASEYPLSEPWALGLFHSVLGGPPSHPPEQWVLACLADSCGRVLVCHSIVQAQRHHKWSGSATLVPTDFPVWDSVSQHLDCLQTEAPKTNLKMSESLLYTFTFTFTFFVCGG
uniref:transmembrane protein 254 isoform X3 n=1 Tax=Callithrix jacchus TaxID=9483 RepID=UPI0023DD2FAF|nr:transmembrane protein 254 isoform X3 [Callithrix jacchus]